MEIRLLRVTKDGVELVADACRITADDLDGISSEDIVSMIVENDYSSALEHIVFTFELRDISIAIARELLEHRIASHSARSTRYCDESGFTYYIPPELDTMEAIEYSQLMESINRYYQKLLNKYGKEVARYVLPIATHCTYIWTINARSLINFLGLRLCVRAAPEIRELAKKVHEIVKKEYPEVFENIGCRGVNLGVCPENEARPKTCPYRNKIPTKKEVKSH